MNIILISIISGIISGLGMGGGTILIIMLVTFVNINQHIAQTLNLMFFIPTAIIACIVNSKQKIIKYKTAFKIIIPGIVGAIIGANVSIIINAQNLKKYFGIFLILIEIYEIVTIVLEYIKSKKTDNNYIQK